MSLQANLRYNKNIIRQAVLCFWWRTVGPMFLVVNGTLLIVFVALLYQRDYSWRVGVLGSVISAGILIVLAIYFSQYRNSLAKFRAMGEPSALFIADESSFTITSDTGSATLAWSSIKELWKFESVWLLLFSKAQFITLPLSDLPLDMQTIISKKVKLTGVKTD